VWITCECGAGLSRSVLCTTVSSVIGAPLPSSRLPNAPSSTTPLSVVVEAGGHFVARTFTPAASSCAWPIVLCVGRLRRFRPSGLWCYPGLGDLSLPWSVRGNAPALGVFTHAGGVVRLSIVRGPRDGHVAARPATSSRNVASSTRTTLDSNATRCGPGYGARLWTTPCAARKTQGSLPSEDTAVVPLFSLVASGQIKLRRIDGWRKIAVVLSQHTPVAA
jgi:hypothetical protein